MGICYGKGGAQYEEDDDDGGGGRKGRYGEGIDDSGSGIRRVREGPKSSPAAASRRRGRGRSESRSAATMRSRESIEPESPKHRASSSPAASWTWASPFRSPFRPQTAAQWETSSPGNATPRRLGSRKPFPPPSPAKHIQSALVRRRGGGGGGGGISATKQPANNNDAAAAAHLPQCETDAPDNASHKPPPILRKYFGYAKNFSIKYEIGDEVGRGHFGHTCRAIVKKGDLKGQSVAVKVISKDKMTSAIAIEDVKREVKILKALSGHPNLVKFYDVCEDTASVYIVMELCEGGELLDRLLSRGGKYSEEEAKAVVVQILSVMSFCHFQGVVHRDLKPENFLFTSNEDTALLKAIDFGLSDFVRPDERLNDIVGSAYYVAPEVLHRSYSLEADMWSVGVITYILLSGSRPFWARTESGIFRSVLKADPPFDVAPWPLMSEEAKDFVKRLLTKDRHRRISAAQALTHPWLRGRHKVPLDILVFRLVKSYIRSSVIRRAALKALAKTLTEDQLFYLRAQFTMLGPAKNGKISLENFRSVLTKNATETMKASKMFDMIAPIDAAQSKKMDFHEFCAAATSVPQLEGLETWEIQARKAYQIFEKEGNRVVLIEDLARELGIPATIPAHVILHDWVRHNDGKLSFFGFTNLLRGMPPRTKHPQSTK